MGPLIGDSTTLSPNCTSNWRGHTGLRGTAEEEAAMAKRTTTKQKTRGRCIAELCEVEMSSVVLGEHNRRPDGEKKWPLLPASFSQWEKRRKWKTPLTWRIFNLPFLKAQYQQA
jgi:hypothetical protein